MTEAIQLDPQEGSFAATWEKYVEDNALTPEVAAKLRSVYYSGAAAVFDELHIATPEANNAAAIHKSAVIFAALNSEVFSFFEDLDDEDLTVLTVKEDDGQADS